MRIRFAQYPPHNLVKLVKKSDEWVVDCLIKNKIFNDTRKGKEQTTAIIGQ